MSTFSVGKNVLIPHDAEARVALDRYPIGELLNVDMLDDRQASFRRFVFAAINLVSKASKQSPDQQRNALLVDTGRFIRVVLANGKAVYVVKSMNRHSMPDDDMRAFWIDARDVISKMLHSFSSPDRETIEAMLKGP